jgi:ParB family transcriptional regulator, chromosome partitioning protein
VGTTVKFPGNPGEEEELLAPEDALLDPNAANKGANPRKRTALGRGLSALIGGAYLEPEAVPVNAPSRSESGWATSSTAQVGLGSSAGSGTATSFGAEPEDPVEGTLLYLPIERIQRNPNQPRQRFSEEELAALSKSIKESGLLQPIVVRRKKEPSGQRGPEPVYEIVAGERRFRAASAAGLLKLPALLRNLDDREALQLAIVENVQRAELNPLEEAQAYQRLVSEFGASQEEVAKSVGRDRSSIANALRLLKLPPEIQSLLAAGRISAGHARALLSVETAEEQKNLVAAIIREGLSVRVAERLATERRSKAPAAEAKAPALLDLEAQLRRALGTKVRLSQAASGKGELRISFYSQADLHKLLELLLPE